MDGPGYIGPGAGGEEGVGTSEVRIEGLEVGVTRKYRVLYALSYYKVPETDPTKKKDRVKRGLE